MFSALKILLDECPWVVKGILIKTRRKDACWGTETYLMKGIIPYLL